MTDQQKAGVEKLLDKFCIDADDLVVHGDCIGADTDFDAICKARGIPRRARPCTIEDMRANCDAEDVYRVQNPMDRNRLIVDDADIMFACPPNFTRIKRGSGTWATIGFAAREDVETYIIYPDGQIV